MSNAERANLIISIIKLENGQYEILSRYGDPTWHFTGMCTSMRQVNGIMNFKKVPETFRNIFKEVLYAYQQQGREGQVRPKPATLMNTFNYALKFLLFLQEEKFFKLSEISSVVCLRYVNYLKAYKRKNGVSLAISGLASYFISVEWLYEMSQQTTDSMPEHPWPESSSSILSGKIGIAGRTSRTLIIPEEIITKLFQAAWKKIEEGERLLVVRDNLYKYLTDRNHQNPDYQSELKSNYLRLQGFQGAYEFNEALLELRTACYIVVATLSGCRVHELANIQNDATYSSEGESGIKYWWLRSISEKTDAGLTEWMIPEAAVKAIKMAERLASSYQLMINQEIARLKEANNFNRDLYELNRHRKAIFLGKESGAKAPRTLSGNAWINALNKFARKIGIEWKFTNHQFRRTFAVFVARNAYGDLRYLREHFKHWSMDMTILYALNEAQEADLYDEILVAIKDAKVSIVEHWLDDDALITGGAAENIQSFRKKHVNIHTYKNRKEMAEYISDKVHIRGTGHGWCIADDAGCGGRGLIEKTRCVGCVNSIIDDRQAYIWKGYYAQQLELLELSDIGSGGKARVVRDLERCASVLRDLGINPVEVFNKKEDIK